MFDSILKKLFSQSPAVALPPLELYNTLSRIKEPFVPMSAREVKMYNCGPTVYDRVTIGNLRSYIFADTIRRTLDVWGYKVDQVINITDVGHLVSDADEGEDKLEMTAKKQKRSAQKIAHEITELWFADLDVLGINRKKIQFPRATEYVDEIIALVKSLEQKGYAYKITDGIYYDTSRFPTYGELGNIDLTALKDGARVEENTEKKNPRDFALWKLSPKRAKRQQEWASPWGKGFPGWHIECTAMIFKLLGRQIDIHTGGIDHIPVHHNNEIAQAEAITGKKYVRYWMHNEFITIEGKRISKSLGNAVYLSQLIDRGLSARALRYLYMTAHYRSPMNFTWNAIEGADAALMRLRRLYLELPPSHLEPDPTFVKDFYEAIADDLNTPRAVARVWDLVKDEAISPAVKKVSLALADKILGLGFGEQGPVSHMEIKTSDLPEGIQELIASREAARKKKDFEKSDEIRKEIESAGFVLKDTPKGPKVTKK